MLEIGLLVMPLEMRPTVDFLWDEVVEGEWNRAMTARAGFRHRSAQLCAAGSAASIAARIS